MYCHRILFSFCIQKEKEVKMFQISGNAIHSCLRNLCSLILSFLSCVAEIPCLWHISVITSEEALGSEAPRPEALSRLVVTPWSVCDGSCCFCDGILTEVIRIYDICIDLVSLGSLRVDLSCSVWETYQYHPRFASNFHHINFQS